MQGSRKIHGMHVHVPAHVKGEDGRTDFPIHSSHFFNFPNSLNLKNCYNVRKGDCKPNRDPINLILNSTTLALDD